MLKTEIEAATAGDADPWLSRNKKWPPESMATPIGLEHVAGATQAGVGGTAVPTGVRIPATWSTVKPATVLAVRFATYRKFLEG